MSDDEGECDCIDATGNRGPRPKSECPVLLEMAELKAPGGRERLFNAYREELAARAAQREMGLSPAEVSRKLFDLGAPTQALEPLKAPNDTVALAAARTFLAQRAKTPALVLMGPAGCGKTVAACYALKDFIRTFPWNDRPSGTTRIPCMFVDGRVLTRLSQFDADQSRWVEAMRGAYFVIVDDIGEEGSDTGRGAVTDLLISRIAQNRATVVTGNLRHDALASRYGAALFDRLRAYAVMPNLWGQKSMRKPGAT